MEISKNKNWAQTKKNIYFLLCETYLNSHFSINSAKPVKSYFVLSNLQKIEKKEKKTPIFWNGEKFYFWQKFLFLANICRKMFDFWKRFWFLSSLWKKTENSIFSNFPKNMARLTKELEKLFGNKLWNVLKKCTPRYQGWKYFDKSLNARN